MNKKVMWGADIEKRLQDVSDARRSELTALLPCPFCGFIDIDSYEGNLGWHIGCSNPYCVFQPSCNADDVEDAVEAWNTRAKR